MESFKGLEFVHGESAEEHFSNLVAETTRQFVETGTVHPEVAAEVQHHVLMAARVQKEGYLAFNEALRVFYENRAKFPPEG